MTSSKRVSLPKSWVLAELGELLTAQYGRALPEAQRNDQGSFPVIGSSGIVGKHDQFCVDQSCVVIGRKGSAGSVHLLKVPSWPIDTAYYVTPPPEIDLHYLYYLLGSLQLVQLDKSTAIPSLSRDDLYRVQIPIAPSNEQTRIVEKLEELLSDLEAGVAELKAAQKKLAQYRQSLLKAAVEGALTADWRARRAARDEPLETGADLLARILTERRARWETRQLAKFKKQGKTPPKGWQAKYPEPAGPDTADLPTLPEGWVWASVDQLSPDDLANGRSIPSANSGPKVLRLTAIRDGCVDLDEHKCGDWSESDARQFWVTEGDLLIVRGNGSLSLVGRMGRVGETSASIAYPDTMIRLRVLDAVVAPSWINLVWNAHIVRSHIERRARTSAGIYKISQPDITSTPIPVPPVREQRRIEERFGEHVEVLQAIELALATGMKQSTAQRKNLLKAAFSGQLVPQDPNDEPASALLARIRAEREGRASNDPARRKRRSAHA